MSLFGPKKKPEEPIIATPKDTSSTPVEEVLKMRSNGMSNNQIVQNLQKTGYKMNQIFNAMNMADLRAAGKIEEEPENDEADYGPEPDIGQYDSQPTENTQKYDYPEPTNQRNSKPTITSVSDDADVRMEEIAEAIIDEKWQELMKNVNKIIEWKNTMETRMSNLEEKHAILKSDYDKLNMAVLGKINEYDENIKRVGTEIKAMDQVFQKVLPTFAENVGELSRLTKTLKEKKKKTE